jgi:hypothetical protein
MLEVSAPLPELPARGHAVVVFVRPSTYAEGQRFPIVDHTGRFLGHSLPASWFETHLPAGDYAFFARAGNVAALQARLLPQRTYFVEVAPRWGFFSGRVQLLAITPRSERWRERERWLAESEGQRLAAPAESDLDPEDILDIVADGQRMLTRYDPEELADRTLLASDGI